jgi:hypothetical protein
MNINSQNPTDNSFEYFSPHFGFSVSVVIHSPTDERLEDGLNFLDPDQILPLIPFLERAAITVAAGNPTKAQDLLQAALSWDTENSLSDKQRFEAMRILDAAFEARAKAYKTWKRRNLIPLVSKAQLVAEIQEAIGTALGNLERIKCEELAEKVNYILKVSLKTAGGTYVTKRIRGRGFSIFRPNVGRAKGSRNSKPKVTYERLVKEIKRFKDNGYGIIPSEKEIAVKFSCSHKTIKNCLLEKGEKRRFSDFVRALLEEK